MVCELIQAIVRRFASLTSIDKGILATEDAFVAWFYGTASGAELGGSILSTASNA